MKGHYVGIGMDKRMLHAMKVGSLASNVSLNALVWLSLSCF